MTDRPSVPLAAAALCADCSSIFATNLGTSCPRCASSSSAPVQSNRAAREIKLLRDDLATIEGALMQIAWAKFSPEFKVSIAKKALAYLDGRKQKTPTASTVGASKGRNAWES